MKQNLKKKTKKKTADQKRKWGKETGKWIDDGGGRVPLSRPICLSTAVDATSNGRKVAVVTLAASLLIQLNR